MSWCMLSTPVPVIASTIRCRPGRFASISRSRGVARSGPARLRPGLPGRQPHVPGEAQQGEGADDPVADVDLPPPEAVAGRGREGVVRVVEALPHRQDAEDEVVTALVAAPVGPEAPQVADGVDAPGDAVDKA